MPEKIENENVRGETVQQASGRTETNHQKIPPVDIEGERAAARAGDQDRIRTITAMCERHGFRDLIEPSITEGKTIDQVRVDVLAKIDARELAKEAEKPGFRLELGVEGRDKFRDAATGALLLRGGLVDLEGRSLLAPGHDELMGRSQVELSRLALRYSNQSDRGTAMEVVGRALTSSDFPLILANIANKALAAGYESAGETWAYWAAVGSVNDFKTHTMVRVSESDDLEEILEDGEYKYGSLSAISLTTPERYQGRLSYIRWDLSI